MAELMETRVSRLIGRMRPHAEKPWFPPAMSVSAAIDYVFFAASPQLVLIVTVLLRGRRWRIVPWCFAAASALGAMAVGLGVALIGDVFISESASALPPWIVEGIATWGLVALFALCAIPVSMRSPVFVAALGGMAIWQIGLAVLAGRLISYHVVAALAALAPARLARIPRVSAMLQSAGVVAKEPLAESAR